MIINWIESKTISGFVRYDANLQHGMRASIFPLIAKQQIIKWAWNIDHGTVGIAEGFCDSLTDAKHGCSREVQRIMKTRGMI